MSDASRHKRLEQAIASGYPGAVNRALAFCVGAAALSLGACGNMADLRPAEGQALPVKPLMAQATPTPEELLTPPAYANPDRIDELMRNSAPRRTDRFDMPPPSGAAPEVPVQALDDEQEEIGPALPQ